MIRYFVRHDIDVWKVYRQAPGEIRTLMYSATKLQWIADFIEESLPGTTIDWNTRAEASFCFFPPPSADLTLRTPWKRRLRL